MRSDELHSCGTIYTLGITALASLASEDLRNIAAIIGRQPNIQTASLNNDS
jgi:hypothetical protein